MAKIIMDTEILVKLMKELASEDRAEYLLEAFRDICSNKPLPSWASEEKKSASVARSPYTPQFEEFWKAYPKQRRIGKGAAAKAWQKIKMDKDELLKLCLEAIKWQKLTEQWRRDNCQFVPHPTTYLNQRRWEDEMPDDIDPNHTPTVKTDMNGREITT